MYAFAQYARTAAQAEPAVFTLPARSAVLHSRHTLAAVVPHIKAEQSASVSKAGESVRFSTLPAIALPAQADAIRSALVYDPTITPIRPPANPGKFGQADTRIAVNKSSGRPDNGDFLVELVIENIITYWVAGGTRKNIASADDPNITQANYPTVVRDLTPSPTAVRAGGLDLLKNQPPRREYWAHDLTVKHEVFHADENEKFGRAGAIVARDWLNRQTARNLDQVEALVGRVAPMVAQHIIAARGAPAADEQRAYDDGAPAYTARAQAIKARGDRGGYAASPRVP